MKKVVKLLVLNKIRQDAKLFLNYGILLLIAVMMILAAVYSQMSLILYSLREHSIMVEFAVGFALGAAFFYKKTPSVMLSSATIFHLKDSPLMNYIFFIKVTGKMILLLIASLVICFLCNENFSVLFLGNLFTAFIVWELALWSKYHQATPIPVSLCICAASMILMLFPVKEAGIAANIVFILILSKNIGNLDWEKYYRDMKYYDRVRAAAARKDFPAMMVIANENSVKDKYKIPFKNVKGIHPLLIKSIVIDAFRETKAMWVIKGIALCGAMISFRLPLNAVYKNCIFMGLALCLVPAIIKSNAQAAASLISKCKYGLFIPAPLWKTAMYYAVFPIIQITIVWLLFSICCLDFTIGIILICVLECITAFLWIQLTLLYPRRQKIVDIAGSVLIAVTLIMALRLT